MQLAASKEFMVNAIYAHSIKVNGYLLSATVHKTECRGNVVMQSPPFYPIAPQTFLLSESTPREFIPLDMLFWYILNI